MPTILKTAEGKDIDYLSPLEKAKLKGEEKLPEFYRKRYYLSRPPWETGVLMREITIDYSDDGETPDRIFPKGSPAIRINRERHAADTMTAYQAFGSDPFRTFIGMGTLILPIHTGKALNWMRHGESEIFDESWDPKTKESDDFLPADNLQDFPESWETILNIAHPNK